ncbi:MAG TPA: VOC family protein [Terriglobales bacterium]|nr:VOC family protein [Terriglobales bacterium]
MAILTRMVGFVTTTNPEAAKAFYSGKLGFAFLRDDEFALVFDANGTMLRVVKARQFAPIQGTVLGWQVDDISAAVQQLSQKGIRFERYEFLHPDAAGICTFPTGDKVAWFKDPDGNVLSLSQHADASPTAQ